MRFLCASNLHLGRRIPGIPEHLHLDPARLSTAAIWNQLVETAVREEVDCVLLAGNLIDRENRLFEPLGPLEQGMTILNRHGIPVIALAGNQDFDTLPRIPATINADALDVLDGDAWDSLTIDDIGTVVGRSAAEAAATPELLAGMPQAGGEPTVALLHASLTDGNAPAGTFQPLRMSEIEDSTVPVWILGHQREPDMVTLDETVIIEPGAVCPLDPTETGAHGVWIVDTAVPDQSRLLAISPVQFEDVDIDVSGTTSLAEIENTIVRALHDTLAAAVQDDPLGQLVCVLCALHLVGTTDHHHELPELTRDLAGTIDIQQGGVIAAITSVEIDTRPDIDLEPLLGRPDPVGELARLLTSLDEETGGGDTARTAAHHALIQRTVTRLQGVHRARVLASVANDPEPDEEAARALLRRESWNVLDALIRQRGVE